MRTTPGRPQPESDGGRERVRTKTALRFAGGYGLSVAISGVVSLAVIPAIIVAAGADAWATIAVAQAVAGFAFVFAVYGWGVVGPTEVARLADDRRGAYYFESLLSRTWLARRDPARLDRDRHRHHRPRCAARGPHGRERRARRPRRRLVLRRRGEPDPVPAHRHAPAHRRHGRRRHHAHRDRRRHRLRGARSSPASSPRP